MLVRPLSTNERAEMPGFTHLAVVTADDLTATVVTTAQALTLCAVKNGDIIQRAIGVPVVPFQNSADATNNTTTVSLGDAGSATRHLAATEANANGTFARVIGSTMYLYTAAGSLLLTVTPKSGTAPNVINRGEYHVFFCLTRSDDVSNAVARAAISKT